MNTHSYTNTAGSAQNRMPVLSEIEHAAMVLRSLGEDWLAQRVERALHPDQTEEGLIIVANDPASVGDEKVVLLPPGVHPVGSAFLDVERHIIGMADQKAAYPVLLLQGEASDVVNTDSGEVLPMHICQSIARIAHCIIEAPVPTVIETYFGDEKQFSDVFFQVGWGPFADALNTGAFTFCNGWHWAITAYGSHYRGRNVLEKGLDGFHQGMMAAIDGGFKPLMRLGQRLDEMLSQR